MKHTKLVIDYLKDDVWELANLDARLTCVLETLVELWPEPLMFVTSIRRTDTENEKAGAKSRIHVVGPPFRAVDIRVTNLTNYLTEARNIAAKINRRWQYDPKRPKMVVAYARSHGTGPHIHLQVHPNTRRKPCRERKPRTV